jgi:spermidine synthase
MADINNKNYAYNEMIVHIPLCSHINPQSVLVVGQVDEDFKNEVAKHEATATYADSFNVEGEFDVILYNGDTLDEQTLAQAQRVLEPKCGIFNCKSSAAVCDIEALCSDVENVAKNFWICQPYKFEDTNAILASKKFHPQAEIVLQVSDLLPDCNYYNTELHNAAFVYPQHMHKALTGIAKR